MQRRRLRSAVDRDDPDQDVVGRNLCILDEDVEIAVVVEDAGVQQLVLGLEPRAAPVFRDQVAVGKRALRVLVQVLHVRVAGHVVQVEVILLHVLAVIALRAGEAEHPLLDDRVLAIPQRKRETQLLMVVANPGDTVLAPTVRTRARMVVREVVPCATIGAVILAHRAPLPFAQGTGPRAATGPFPRARRPGAALPLSAADPRGLPRDTPRGGDSRSSVEAMSEPIGMVSIAWILQLLQRVARGWRL